MLLLIYLYPMGVFDKYKESLLYTTIDCIVFRLTTHFSRLHPWSTLWFCLLPRPLFASVVPMRLNAWMMLCNQGLGERFISEH